MHHTQHTNGGATTRGVSGDFCHAPSPPPSGRRDSPSGREEEREETRFYLKPPTRRTCTQAVGMPRGSGRFGGCLGWGCPPNAGFCPKGPEAAAGRLKQKRAKSMFSFSPPPPRRTCQSVIVTRRAERCHIPPVSTISPVLAGFGPRRARPARADPPSTTHSERTGQIRGAYQGPPGVGRVTEEGRPVGGVVRWMGVVPDHPPSPAPLVHVI